MEMIIEMDFDFAFFIVELNMVCRLDVWQLITQTYGLRDYIDPHLNSKPCSIFDKARKIKIYFLNKK